ncbi:MAG: hypothetical protein H8E42_07075 [Nitrospinae bacterium]|nr:hypothetical protein [Nitrospinota bacterium]MBL7020280.1 hypothetical protein [Nitrospinaceae bacterium]
MDRHCEEPKRRSRDDISLAFVPGTGKSRANLDRHAATRLAMTVLNAEMVLCYPESAKDWQYHDPHWRI